MMDCLVSFVLVLIGNVWVDEYILYSNKNNITHFIIIYYVPPSIILRRVVYSVYYHYKWNE